MRVLQKHRGFTLTEVLISLILIGVIVGGLLTFFAGGYNNVLRQRGQNTINFDIQQEFETKLAEIKKNGGNGTEVETFTYRIGSGASQSLPVEGQTLTYKDNTVKNIHLFAANKRESVLQVPDDLAVDIPNSKRFYYVGETTPGGTVGITDTQQKSKARIYTESGWFLSDRSLGTAVPGIVPVGNIGNVGDGTISQITFPQLPTDYRQISTQDSGVRISDEMRGRYLTFAARAINSFGKVGSYQDAKNNRIWVMGLPITGNLSLHTDADLATMRDGTRIPTNNQPQTNINIRDYSNNKVYGGTIPVLNYHEDTINQARQLIALNGNTMQFSGHNFNSFTTSILIGNRQQSGKLMTYKMDNSLTWGINLESDGRIALITTDDSAANNSGQQIVTSTRLDYSKDNSIQVRTSSANDRLTIELFVNGTLAHTQQLALRANGTTHNINSGVLFFSGNTYINEFAVYKQRLSDSDLGKLTAYFRDKYATK